MTTKQEVSSKQSRVKREKIFMRDLEKEFNFDFGVRGDMELRTYLRKVGLPSLVKVVDKLTIL